MEGTLFPLLSSISSCGFFELKHLIVRRHHHPVVAQSREENKGNTGSRLTNPYSETVSRILFLNWQLSSRFLDTFPLERCSIRNMDLYSIFRHLRKLKALSQDDWEIIAEGKSRRVEQCVHIKEQRNTIFGRSSLIKFAVI